MTKIPAAFFPVHCGLKVSGKGTQRAVGLVGLSRQGGGQGLVKRQTQATFVAAVS